MRLGGAIRDRRLGGVIGDRRLGGAIGDRTLCEELGFTLRMNKTWTPDLSILNQAFYPLSYPALRCPHIQSRSHNTKILHYSCVALDWIVVLTCCGGENNYIPINYYHSWYFFLWQNNHIDLPEAPPLPVPDVTVQQKLNDTHIYSAPDLERYV